MIASWSLDRTVLSAQRWSRILLEYGFANLRCFVRPSSELGRLEKAARQFDAGRNVELVIGDLLSREDCRKAAEGVSIIYHLAAGMEKSFAGAFMNSALATRNVMDAFLECDRPKRFVNVSSFAVYSNLDLKRGACSMKVPVGKCAPGTIRRLRFWETETRGTGQRIRQRISAALCDSQAWVRLRTRKDES